MKRLLLLLTVIGVALWSTPVYAGGGSVGGPGTGIKLRFGNGGTNAYLPFQAEAEGYLGSEGQHGVGGAIGYEIGFGNAFGYFHIAPEYRYYFNGGSSSGPFVGGYTHFGFGSNRNLIGMGAVGGYAHFFSDAISLVVRGNLGFASLGFKFGGGFFGGGTTRGSTGELGATVGVRWHWGN